MVIGDYAQSNIVLICGMGDKSVMVNLRNEDEFEP
jgi:hypothetical protein